jgi:hypothetical protein
MIQGGSTANSVPRVVSELSPEVIAAFTDAQIVALDVEGVDLSRAGTFSSAINLYLIEFNETTAQANVPWFRWRYHLARILSVFCLTFSTNQSRTR